jgi:DNA-binding PadR family transcriptional regulator
VGRADWLLLLIADAGGENASQPIDPVRIMKGLFLLSKEDIIPRGDQYSFSAYAYGPVAFEVYDDLDKQVAAGLISAEAVPGRTWSVYRATPVGLERAKRLASQLGAKGRAIMEKRRYVLSRPFVRLLREIYDRFPEYAVNTVMES